MEQRNLIERIASLRSNLIELMLVAVVLGFGVGLSASSLSALLQGSEIWGVVLGIGASAGSVLYLLLKVIPSRPDVFRIRGFLHLVQTDQSVEVREADRYKLSEKISSYLRAAFSENPALLRAWLNNPVRCHSGQQVRTDRLTGNTLLNQAVEYFFLDRLSLHLGAYFQEHGIEEEELQKFTRSDIPDVLLQNRFLELFSKPMEERDQFVDRLNLNDEPQGRVVMAFGRDGALFDMFELVLPKGSRVSRSSSGIVRIETAVFSLEFDPGVEGFATTTARRFEELYMGDPHLCHNAPYLVKSEIRVKIKRRALFSRSGWEYYRWLDSFINDYYEKADAEAFLIEIGWETAATMNRIALYSATKANQEAGPTGRGDA